MRRLLADTLYDYMSKNSDIYLIVGDLGYKVWDKHFKDFRDRCINVGASEQAMMDIAVGIAYSGKIPFVYSITTFLLYRPFETLRTYINYEKLNIKLVGSGRNDDYKHDGISHWAEDAGLVLNSLPNITQYWPQDKKEIPSMVKEMLLENGPTFISLKR